jgi:hypothetical protein
MHRLARGQRVAALVFALSVTVAACSSNGGANLAEKNPKAAMAAASRQTVSAKTVHLSLTAQTDKGIKVLDGSGAYDFPTSTGRFTLKTALGAGADMVTTSNVIYLKSGQAAGATQQWLSFTKAEVATAQAAANGRATFLASIRTQVDPRSTLDALGSNVPNLRKIGTAKIRGTATTHVAGRVDLSDKAIAAAPASRRASMRAARTTVGSDGYPVDVWLDRHGRVCRVQYVLTSGAAPNVVSTTVKLDLYDFGKPSGITVPAAAEVTDGASQLVTPTTTTPAKKK